MHRVRGARRASRSTSRARRSAHEVERRWLRDDTVAPPDVIASSATASCSRRHRSSRTSARSRRFSQVDGVVRTRLEQGSDGRLHRPPRRPELPRGRDGAPVRRVARRADLSAATVWAYGDSAGDAELLPGPTTRSGCAVFTSTQSFHLHPAIDGPGREYALANDERSGSVEAKLAELKDRLGEVTDLRSAAAVLVWDMTVLMPPAGAAGGPSSSATLEEIVHERAHRRRASASCSRSSRRARSRSRTTPTTPR